MLQYTADENTPIPLKKSPPMKLQMEVSDINSPQKKDKIIHLYL